MRRLVALLVLGAAVVVAVTLLRGNRPAFVDRQLYPLSYAAVIRGHARNYRLDPTLLAAVVYQESKFRRRARSSSGAIGLMQLLPDTAKGIALHTGGTRFRVDDLYDPELNVRYGAWYLRHLLDKYHDERTALAAYNAGQWNVDRWRRERTGIGFAETRHYVDRVEKLKRVYRRAYGRELGI